MRPSAKKLTKLKLSSYFFALAKITILIGLGLGLFGIYRYLFTIRHISCQFGSAECPPEVLAELNRLNRQNLLRINKNELQSKIVAGSPLFSAAALIPGLPGKISLSLTKADLNAQLATSTVSGVLVVSDTNQTISFQPAPVPGLALIISPQAHGLTVGQTVTNPLHLGAIKLATALNEYFIPFSYISISPTGLVQAHLGVGFPATFDLDGNLVDQITSLRLILNQLSDEPVAEIDLRLTRPIIKFVGSN